MTMSRPLPLLVPEVASVEGALLQAASQQMIRMVHCDTTLRDVTQPAAILSLQRSCAVYNAGVPIVRFRLRGEELAAVGLT